MHGSRRRHLLLLAAVLACAAAPVAAETPAAGWSASLTREPPRRAPDPGPAPRAASPKPAAPSAAKPTGPGSTAPDAPLPPGALLATGARLVATPQETRFHVALTQPIKAEVYAVARPHRIVIDLPEPVVFRALPRPGQQPAGLVASWRGGLVAERQSRIVLDLTQPARIASAQMVAQSDGSAAFAVSLVPTSEAEFVKTAYEPPSLRRQTFADDPAPPTPKVSAPAASQPKAAGRPVIVLDPGHGGIDSGAVGQTEIAEKDIVLAVARTVRDALLATGRYDVHMTRDADIYVPLAERVLQSEAVEADLFISIHADALADEAAAKVRGATVYTLSERASDTQAQRLAEKENASDALAGLGAVAADERDAVGNILFDLMKTETSRFSSEFGALVTDRLRRTIALSRTPRRSAAFRVLKQAQSPSVLVELGYMSHAADEKAMTEAKWQQGVARAITAAVDAYFAKPRTARR